MNSNSRSGRGAALQLDQVQAQGIEPGQDLVQGAGPVGQDHHEGGLIRTGVDLQILGDADEPGEVVAPVLDVCGQPLQAVELNAAVGGDGGHVGAVGLGHGGRGGGGVLAGGNLHVLAQLLQEGGALADGLGGGRKSP